MQHGRVKHVRYGRQVVPLSLETYGRWGPQGLGWWRALAQDVAGRDPALAHLGKWAVPALLNRWWAVTAVTLQRSNVLALWSSSGWQQPRWKPAAPGAPVAWELLCDRLPTF